MISQIDKAECVLEKQKQANMKSDPTDFSKEFYSLLPFKPTHLKQSIKNKRILFERFELCQLIRDIISVCEETNWSLRSSAISKYRSIGAYISRLNEASTVFDSLKRRVESEYVDEPIQVLNIYEVIRPNESLQFDSSLHNQAQLYHGSNLSNFLGILSRGLQLPKYVLDEHGIIENRTDIGLLGAGIYFSDSFRTSLKYTNSANRRLGAVCDVALGDSKLYYDYEHNLTKPPDGYHSCRGVKRDHENESKFVDNEFVIYNIKQNRLRYVIEISLNGIDGLTDLVTITDNVDVNDEIKLEKQLSNLVHMVSLTDEQQQQQKDLSIESLEKGKQVLKEENCGLVSGSSGKNIPLVSIHVRAQLIDILSKVVIFQEYINEDSEPIEAKFLFPLNDSSAVCGFEAFINDKRVIGVCKEKEQAHREYKEAIERGDGAYLMDQETAELFKVNVGNLPPKSRCIIKITYVAELDIDSEQIQFKLPSNIAPWQAMKYDGERLQDSVLSKLINTLNLDLDLDGESPVRSSFKASILMPFEIKAIRCPTHLLNVKRTACQAVCELDASKKNGLNQTLIIGIHIATIHMPRMFVEDYADAPDPDDESAPNQLSHLKRKRACMVSFYPEFETKANPTPKIYFLLDSSNSMSYLTNDSYINAKKLLLLMLNHLTKHCLLKVMS